MNSNIQKACDLLGGQTALANRLSLITGKEVTQQRVRNWLVRDDEVPAEFAAPIEAATNGVVTRKEIRSKDWWIIWPELDAPKNRRKGGCPSS